MKLCKPSTIVELKQVINDFAILMYVKLIKKVCASARKRLVKMLEVPGGHFEHFLFFVMFQHC